MKPGWRWRGGLMVIAVCAQSPAAHAADEEIQVYLNEIIAPRTLGLDVHVNYAVSGDGSADYVGAQSGLHRLRVTPEFSYALDDKFELGLYLPLATLDRTRTLRVDGAKVRLKWLPRHPDRGFYYGANYELGRVDHGLDQNAWNNEIKLIGGWAGGRWIIGANANVDFALSGPAQTPASVQLATRIGYTLGKATVLGIESYNGLGSIRRIGHFSHNDQTVFATIDTRLGRWDIQTGIGKGYGSSKDDVIVKMIIGVPIGK